MRLVIVGHLGKKNEERERERKKRRVVEEKKKYPFLTLSWWVQNSLRHLMEKFGKY